MADAAPIDSPERRCAKLMALVDQGTLSQEELEAELARVARERADVVDEVRAAASRQLRGSALSRPSAAAAASYTSSPGSA